MRVLVTGANGFIGSHLAAQLNAAGHEVIGSARDARAARRRYPQFDWIQADFRDDVDWPLGNIDAVVNCVGVLQDGGGDSTLAAHVSGAKALFEACERQGVRRVIHLSAVGADAEAGTAYAMTKAEGERQLMSSALDWVVLRPSLVVASGVYGGTAMLRGLAAIPWMTPLVASRASFNPVHMHDLGEVVSALLAPGAPRHIAIDVAGPQSATLEELLAAYRRWLGFKQVPFWQVPRWLSSAAFFAGDALGRLGLRSPLQSTSQAQMDYQVGGDADAVPRCLGLRPRPYEAALLATPASVQDRWHARLYFVKPLAVLALAVFWLASGLIALTGGNAGAVDLARQAGFTSTAHLIVGSTSMLDVALGTSLLIAARHRRLVLAAMALVTVSYALVIGTVLPDLWLDPLGPLVKLIPGLALYAMLAAVEDSR